MLSTAVTCVFGNGLVSLIRSISEGIRAGGGYPGRLAIGLKVAQGVMFGADEPGNRGRRFSHGVVDRHLVHREQAERHGNHTGPEQ